MSIFSALGKVFGFKGDAAQAFGTGLAEGGAKTFTAGLNKAIDKFDKRVEETGRTKRCSSRYKEIHNIRIQSCCSSSYTYVSC